MTPLRRLRRAAIDVEPLRHATFRRLWAGNSLGLVGFQLTAVAVPVQVYELTGSSFWVGMLGLVGLVPLVLFGLWGGAVADAVDRRAAAARAPLSHSLFVCRVWQRERLAPAWMTALDRLPGQTLWPSAAGRSPAAGSP